MGQVLQGGGVRRENVILSEEIDSWDPTKRSPSFLTTNSLSAVAEVHPSSTGQGCFFRHKKSLFKHLRQAHMIEEYLVPDSPVRESFSMMAAIAFFFEHRPGDT